MNRMMALISGHTLWRSLCGPMLLLFFLLASCGTFELGIESTPEDTPSPPAIGANQVGSTPSQGGLTAPTAIPQTPIPSGTIPLTPTEQPDSNEDLWPGGDQVYTNAIFNISLTYPAGWEAVPGYSTYGDKFTGDDGFFIVNAAGGDSIDVVAGSEADHRLRPYGSHPMIEITRIQGQEARFIWPSVDAAMEGQSGLIVRLPQPVTLAGNRYDYFVLYANQEHMRDLAQTLRFGQVASTVETTATSDTSEASLPDTLVARLVSPEGIFPQFGDIATMRADGSELNQITTYRYNADPVLSPDGQRIAYRSVPISITSLPNPTSRLHEGQYNIWVITIDGEKAWQLTQSEEIRSVPTWSADSRRVAFSQGVEGELIEVEIDDESSRQLARDAFAPRYRPDGNGIGFITGDGGLTWMDEDGSTYTIVSATQLPGNSAIHDFDWFPDSHHLAYTLATDIPSETGTPDPAAIRGPDYSVWIASLASPDPVKLADQLHDVDVSPDGKMIAALQGSGFADACFVDSRLRLLQVMDDRKSVLFMDLAGFVGYPEVSQDQSFYPRRNLTWVSDQLGLVEFDLTCRPVFTSNGASGPAGWYAIDTLGQQMARLPDSGSE